MQPSKTQDKYIVPGDNVIMRLQETVDITVDSDTRKVIFDNKDRDPQRLQPDQILVSNNASRKVDMAVGFVEGTNFNSAAYISGLLNGDNWFATYKPHMNLYVVDDLKAKHGQIINTISNLSGVVYTWELARDYEVPPDSRWILFINEETSSYEIKMEGA
ncbi:hypothetical protein DXG01_011732 [Tephrocybe rancida]|nr:hypothetical protein DXG01_011732 [Tephrocybe rancida]